MAYRKVGGTIGQVHKGRMSSALQFLTATGCHKAFSRSFAGDTHSLSLSSGPLNARNVSPASRMCTTSLASGARYIPDLRLPSARERDRTPLDSQAPPLAAVERSGEQHQLLAGGVVAIFIGVKNNAGLRSFLCAALCGSDREEAHFPQADFGGL